MLDLCPSGHARKDPMAVGNVFIYLLESYSPDIRTGLFTKSNVAEVENNTKHAHLNNNNNNGHLSLPLSGEPGALTIQIKHKNAHTHIYIHIHTYTHTYIHTDTHIHIYIFWKIKLGEMLVPLTICLGFNTRLKK